MNKCSLLFFFVFSTSFFKPLTAYNSRLWIDSFHSVVENLSPHCGLKLEDIETIAYLHRTRGILGIKKRMLDINNRLHEFKKNLDLDENNSIIFDNETAIFNAESAIFSDDDSYITRDKKIFVALLIFWRDFPDRYPEKVQNILSSDENSSALMQLTRGIVSQFGIGADLDYDTAAYYYRHASNKGCALSTLNLAVFYYNKVIEPTENENALSLLEGLENNQQHTDASSRFLLSVILLQNNQTQEGINEAKEIYSVVAYEKSPSFESLFHFLENGFDDYNISLMDYYDYRIQHLIKVLRKLGNNCLLRNAFLAFNYFKEAGELGCSKSYIDCGILVYNNFEPGEFVFQGDLEIAKSYFELSLKQGYADAGYFLAFVIYESDGISNETYESIAVNLFIAASKGNQDAKDEIRNHVTKLSYKQRKAQLGKNEWEFFLFCAARLGIAEAFFQLSKMFKEPYLEIEAIISDYFLLESARLGYVPKNKEDRKFIADIKATHSQSNNEQDVNLKELYEIVGDPLLINHVDWLFFLNRNIHTLNSVAITKHLIHDIINYLEELVKIEHLILEKIEQRDSFFMSSIFEYDQNSLDGCIYINEQYSPIYIMELGGEIFVSLGDENIELSQELNKILFFTGENIIAKISDNIKEIKKLLRNQTHNFLQHEGVEDFLKKLCVNLKLLKEDISNLPSRFFEIANFDLSNRNESYCETLPYIKNRRRPQKRVLRRLICFI